MGIELTQHAYERGKERNIGTGYSVYKNAEKAYRNGKTPDQYPKELRKYLENTLKSSKGNTVKVWSNYVFIFYDNILITVFPLSQKLIQHAQRKKVKNYGCSENI